jgi:hypothetical protein
VKVFKNLTANPNASRPSSQTGMNDRRVQTQNKGRQIQYAHSRNRYNGNRRRNSYNIERARESNNVDSHPGTSGTGATYESE